MNVQEVIEKLAVVRLEMGVYAALTRYLNTELTPSDVSDEAPGEHESGVLGRVREHLEEQTWVLQQQESALLEAQIDE